eukprot:gene9087-12256_t
MCENLKYVYLAFQELFLNDGLLVMGKGLGLQCLFSKFVKCYANDQDSLIKKKLIFIINGKDVEEACLNLLLQENTQLGNLPKFISNEVNSQERIDLYSVGGCYFITSRILIVDLLDNKIDPVNISGILVYNAHRLSETSIESFILKVYREKNRDGFIKAFSDDPDSLNGRFGKVERLLKVLYVKKLYLWPRFRLEISHILEERQPEVIELAQSLTINMTAIQNAILVSLQTCINELKKASPQLEVNFLTLENGLFHNFDYILRSQLDPEWHKIPFRTKQLVSDLAVLRKLLDYLIRYDAFSFYYLLLKVKQSSNDQNAPSLWLTSEAADHIFKRAKDRVYRIQSLNMNTNESNLIPEAEEFRKSIFHELGLQSEITPILECPPKWKLLQEIIKEIKVDYNKISNNNNNNNANFLSNQGRLLLIVKDELALTQIRDVIINGDEYVMDQRYRWFISQQSADIRARVGNSKLKPSIRINNNDGKSKPISSNNNKNDKNSVSSTMNDLKDGIVAINQSASGLNDQMLIAPSVVLEMKFNQAMSEEDELIQNNFMGLKISKKDLMSLHFENQLILIQERILQLSPAAVPTQQSSTEEKRVINEFYKDLDNINNYNENEFDEIYDDVHNTNVETNEKMVDNKMKTGKKTGNNSSNNNSKGNKRTIQSLFGQQTNNKKVKNDQTSHTNLDEVDDTADDLEEENKLTAAFLDPDFHISVVTQNQINQNFSLLFDMQPAYIILYDSDIAVMRTIEAYQATTPVIIKLYCLLYDSSAEEHRYVGALAKEKKAFESLISIKEHLVVSLPDNPLDLENEKAADFSLNSSYNDTRLSKNNNVNKTRKIVVDVREFRSILPSILYNNKFEIVPRTLYIGDYILSPDIAVERKGISDLFQSFASGRLYNQIEAMSRYYKYPVLLIEFNPDKPFTLVAPGEITSEIQQNSILSRISILTQSFPNLRLLWSKSPAATADIFRSIVINHEEVDVMKAVSLGGVGENNESDIREEEDARINAQEILLTLPGINPLNYSEIINKVENIAELSKMSENELSPLIGPINAKKLVAYFRQRIV